MQQQISSISNFKKFLLKFFVPFIMGLTIFGLLFSYFFEKAIIFNSPVTGASKINRIINESHPDEIPIFGSSRAEGSFVPSWLGENYFNYGITGVQDNVVLFFMKEECKKNKSTPLILNFDLEGLDYSLFDIGNYIPNSSNTEIQKLLGDKYEAWFHIPFVKYYGKYENYLKSYLSSKMELTKYVDNGAQIEKNTIAEDKFRQLVKEREDTATVFINDAVLLNGYLEVISKNAGRKFIIVVTPYHTSYFKRFDNADEAFKFLFQLDSLPNVEVLDFSKVNYSDSLFINTTHLNYAGAVEFNRQLKDSLYQLLAK